jgi:hypothetical protein
LANWRAFALFCGIIGDGVPCHFLFGTAKITMQEEEGVAIQKDFQPPKRNGGDSKSLFSSEAE